MLHKQNIFRLMLLLFPFLLLGSNGCKKEKIRDGVCEGIVSSYAPGPAGTYPQAFSVQGNQIIDETGAEVVFRGASIESPPVLARSFDDKASNGSFYFKKLLEWDENIFTELSNWGATIVRLPVYPATWRTLGETYCLQKIDEAILWASNHNLYVIVEWHSLGYPPSGDYENNISAGYGQLYETTPEEMNSFWNITSQRYKNNKTVAFYELFNEPTFPDFESTGYVSSINLWNEWKTLAETTIDTIRLNDPLKPIIVGSPNWSYDLQYVTQAPIQKSGIIYTAHIYPGVNSSITWDEAFGNAKATYPIFATEIGYLLGNPFQKPYWAYDYVPENGNPTEKNFHCAIKQYLESKNISWTAWNFSPYVWPKLLKTKDFKPTNAGEFFKQWMQEAK